MSRLIAVLAVAVALSVSAVARADERLFTFSYDVTTMAPGTWEYEQYVTWKTDKDNDDEFDRIDFRHEFEVGITDNFQLGFYISDWRYQDGKRVANDRAEWRNIAVEAILNLSSPVNDPIGFAIYGEIILGDEKMALELKLLLEKHVGPFVFIYNFVFEPEWEGDHYQDDKLELQNTFGISYQISPQWSVGAEVVHEIEYADWNTWEDHVVYVGPNVAFRAKGWWVTITPMVQVTDVASEANFQTRLLFGIDF